MVWMVIRKEIAGHLLSFRFGLALVLCAVVVLTSTLAIYRQYEQRTRDYALCQARQGEARASIPPVLTSVLAWGLEDVTGRTVDLTQLPMVLTHALQSPLNIFDGFFPTLDLTYVVRMIGALVALGFAFDAVCGEGRSGTLALSLAVGASRGGILLGKLIGGYVVVVLLFLIPAFFGLILLKVFAGALLDLDMLARTSLWCAGTVLYLGCFFCLGLLVSTLIDAPRTALMACLVMWTTLTFVIPDGITSLFRVGTYLQSPTRFEQVNFYSMTMRQSSANGERELDRQFQRREERAHEVVEFAESTLSALRLFPGTAYVDLSANLAGTGIAEMPRYFGAVQRYMRAVQAAREEGVEIPAFTFQRASIDDGLRHSTAGIISLLVWGAAAFWGAATAFSRYDVRVKEGRQS